MNSLRDLPSIEQLLQNATHLIERFGRPLTVDALRTTLDETRARFKADPETALPSTDLILAQAESHLSAWTASTLYPVINATGVILHTNLGRAPLSKATIKAMQDVASGYSNLEYDLSKGKRGSRLIHAEAVLQRLTGAEAALVVNNNASALLLILSALASKKRVVIARSQLVEIGTTNKVRSSDYENTLEEKIALVMRAHRSNFKMVGFTEEPELKDIVDVAHKAGVPVVDDLGSGALMDTAKYGLAHEPTVQESLAAGADIVCFSGDKLLGGPQAGIIIGKKSLLDKIKKHPLARAVRADKTSLAGVTATLTHYLKDEAEQEVPIVKMMSLTLNQLKVRVETWQDALGNGDVVKSESTVGGGSLPDESMPTFVLSLSVKSPDKFMKKLRESSPPVIARVENDNVYLDPRTVLDEQDVELISVVRSLL